MVASLTPHDHLVQDGADGVDQFAKWKVDHEQLDEEKVPEE
jgi:hypothetical protein